MTVLQYRTDADAAGGMRLLVEVRYEAAQAFEVRPEAWSIVLLDGELVVGEAASSGSALQPATLEAGENSTGWIEFAVEPDTADLFLDFQDPFGSTLFIVALF